MLATPALAAQVVGNGGDAVVCRDVSGAIQKAELYDFYEGRVQRGLHIALPIGADPVAVATATIERIKTLDPARYARLAARIPQFMGETQMVNSSLTPIPDMGVVLLDPACKTEQLAIHRDPELPFDKTFLIAQEIWGALPTDHQAGLILHELIYEDARLFGHQDSQASRYLNALIGATELQTLQPDAYAALLRQLCLQDGMYQAHNANGSVTIIEQFLDPQSNQDAWHACEASAPSGATGTLLGESGVFVEDNPVDLPNVDPLDSSVFAAALRRSDRWWYAVGAFLKWHAKLGHYSPSSPGNSGLVTPYPYICRYDTL
jgi:hypothetical protein